MVNEKYTEDSNTQELLRDTRVEIDLDKIAYNMNSICKMVGPDVAVMAVIKANGYGHGSCAIAPVLLENGAAYLAVATLTEALELKDCNPQWPVFIMGYTPDRLLHHIVERDITQTVFSLEQAQILNQAAAAAGKKARVHIKVDTGFHRLGKSPSPEFAEEICRIYSLPAIDVEGIFSHLALAGDKENQEQFHSFSKFVSLLESRGCRFKYKHVADSIACVDFPEYRLNMIRPGALIYGMAGYHKGFLPVEQVLTFKTAISQIHHVPAGEGVSYDYMWKSQRDSLIATLPFGYADGYPRNLRDKGYVIIKGVKAPIVGVICMDQCMADVTDVPDVKQGMEAIIYGSGKDGSMTIAEAASLAETNKNDIIARIAARPPRIYKKSL